MGIKRSQYLIFLLSFLLSVGTVTTSIAQEEYRIERINGERYILHTVKPKETLYGISKKYDVTVSDLKKANPILDKEGLKIGQVVKILYTRDVRKDLRNKEVKLQGDTIFHTVLTKETLYSLSKRYKINIEQIHAWNPSIAKDGLKEGSTIAIPYTESPLIDENNLKRAREDSLLLHEVKPKETLYSLSKLYKVSVDSIQIVNPNLGAGLQVGQTIRIPIANPRYLSGVKPPNLKYQLSEKDVRLRIKEVDTAVIALMLPFYLERNDTLDTLKISSNVKRAYHISKSSYYALDFYRGFRIAIDSLSAQGLNFKIKVFDTGNDKAKIDKIISSGELNDVQLIIGPLFRSNFAYVADKLKDQPIGMVSPVKISSKILLDREHLAKVVASDPAHIIGLSKHVANNYPPHEIVLVDNGRSKDRYHFELAKKYINGSLRDTTDSILAVNIFTFSEDRLNALVGDSGHTAIVIPSEDQAYVTKALITLNSYVQKREKVKITVFGLEKWLEFTNLSSSMLMRLNVHLVAQHFEDYQSPKVKNYIKRYRTNYTSDPNHFGFLGFDVGYFFLQCASDYGAGCITKLPDLTDEMLTTKYKFIKVGAESGYENSAVYVLQFHDYELKRRD